MKRFLLVLLALGLGACGGDAGEADEAQSGREAATGGSAVEVKGFLFKPTPLEVKAGTEVTWTNQDQILHTVTAGKPDEIAETFRGEMAERGAVFSFTFADPGTYPYFCERHNSMTGTVVVS